MFHFPQKQKLERCKISFGTIRTCLESFEHFSAQVHREFYSVFNFGSENFQKNMYHFLSYEYFYTQHVRERVKLGDMLNVHTAWRFPRHGRW